MQFAELVQLYCERVAKDVIRLKRCKILSWIKTACA